MLEDGAYKCVAIIRDRAGDDERKWIRENLRRTIAKKLMDYLEPNTPVAVELFEKTDRVPSSYGHHGWDEQITAAINIRRVQTINLYQHKMDEEFLKVPRYLPPKPLQSRVVDWFKRTWREVHEYDGPRG